MSLPLTQGAVELAKCGTISDTAKRLGVADRTVVSWRTGRVVPSDGSRQTIKRVLGIEPSAFDRAVTLLEAASSPTDEPMPPEPPTSTGDAAAAPEPRESAERRLRDQMARLAAMRAGVLSDSARVQVERLELAASRSLARLESLEDLTTERLMKSRVVEELQARIVAALEAHPDAMKAVAIALEPRGRDAA